MSKFPELTKMHHDGSSTSEFVVELDNLEVKLSCHLGHVEVTVRELPPLRTRREPIFTVSCVDRNDDGHPEVGVWQRVDSDSSHDPRFRELVAGWDLAVGFGGEES